MARNLATRRLAERNSVCLAGLLAWSVLCPAQAASKPRPCDGLALPSAVVAVNEGAQQDQQLPLPIKRLAVGDPKIADVQLVDKRSFLVTGKAQGETSLLVWTGCPGDPLRARVQVAGRALNDVAAAPAQPAVPLANQVQTDIRFVEVSRSKLKQASTSLVRNGSNLFALGSPGGLSGLSVGADGAVSGSIAPGDSGFNIIWGGGSSKVLGFLNMLEGSGFAYTLARPSLVATSGQSASFLAGGEFPIPVPNGDSNNITIEYKEYGVRLTLTPTVIGPGRIALKVAPEVSELDFTAGIKTNGIAVPALNVRRTDTSVVLADGESFVISGLISSNTVSNVDKFPGLGNLPVLGAFFRSSQLSKDDRELLMVVTPHLVQPLAASANLPKLPGEGLRDYDPGFGEFYFQENGRFDGRRSSNGMSE